MLAAIAIRDRAEIDVRIGINSGFVVVGPIGDDLWMDYSVFGDAAILAGRRWALKVGTASRPTAQTRE